MNIIKNTNFKTHNTSIRTDDIKYIVMHYTASDGGTAANHISYFNNPSTTNASADFFVDEKSIYQYNTQLDGRYSWAVGDGSGGKCWNRNQISVEMCCYQSNGKWYIKDGTYKNAVELVKYLMSKYSIPASTVIRHYDVSRKLCPNAVGWLSSTGSETTWNKFKSEIKITKANANTAATVTTIATKKSPDIKYQVYTEKSGWLPVVTNLEDYAGVDGQDIKGIRVSVNGDTVAVDTHQLNNGNMDKLTVYAGKHTVRYRVRPIDSKDYLD